MTEHEAVRRTDRDRATTDRDDSDRVVIREGHPLWGIVNAPPSAETMRRIERREAATARVRLDRIVLGASPDR